MADGSCRFINDDIDKEVFRALGSRNGAEDFLKNRHFELAPPPTPPSEEDGTEITETEPNANQGN